MVKFDGFARHLPSVTKKYGLSVLLVAISTYITLLLQESILIIPLFFLAILLSAWFGGVGPGLLAAMSATLALDYFFVAPIHSLGLHPSDLPNLFIYLASAVLVSSWSAGRKRAERSLQQARDELEAKVEERTAELSQSNEQLRTEVAERRRAEETLCEQANLLNLTHDAIIVRDMNGVITYWNRGAEELYGWGAEYAIGRRSYDLVQTTFPAPLEEINAEVLRSGRWEGDLVQKKRDGARLIVASRWGATTGGVR